MRNRVFSMTTLSLTAESPPLRVWDDGSIRIGHSRVILAVFLNAYHDWGWSAEQLAEQFPTVSLAESHAVIAYYLRHRTEVDSYLNEWNGDGDRERTEWLASPEGQRVQAKLRAARLARITS